MSVILQMSEAKNNSILIKGIRAMVLPDKICLKVNTYFCTRDNKMRNSAPKRTSDCCYSLLTECVQRPLKW